MIYRKIPFFASLTINHAYWHKGYTKVLTSQAKKMRERIEEALEDLTEEEIGSIRGKHLEVQVVLGKRWYAKKGTMLRQDLANYEKFFIDSVFKCLEVDDSFIWRLIMEKAETEDGEEFTTLYISGID